MRAIASRLRKTVGLPKAGEGPLYKRIISVTRQLTSYFLVLGFSIIYGFSVLLGHCSANTVLAAADESATRERRYHEFSEQRVQLQGALNADLDAVERWCLERQLDDAKRQVSELRETLKFDSKSPRPPRLAQSPVAESLPVEEQQWQLQVLHHRTERAKEMYAKARSALRAGFPSLAYAMIGDVLQMDPDHKLARSILGQQLFRDPLRKDDAAYAGEWVSSFEAEKRSGGKPHIYDPRFGWIPASTLARYEQGLRPWKGDWVSVSKEAELRRDFRNAWVVESEHFLVRTNVGLEEGVRLTEQLELFYDWLQQNFAAFFETPETMKERFEEATTKRAKRRQSAPLEVHYFASRDEYNRRLQGKIPANRETNGLYWQPDRTCYFFRSEHGADLTTLYHEATHLILDVHTDDDRRKAARARALKLKQKTPEDWGLCERSNFWIVEGLACYFESFESTEDGISVGDPSYVRFDTARQRLLEPDVFFYMPSRQFFTLGKDGFQKHPNISQLYTQASGMVHFLMHYEDGVYRDDFVELLSEVYRPNLKDILKEPSLIDITGVTGDELDRQYREHMKDLEEQVLRNASPSGTGSSDTESSGTGTRGIVEPVRSGTGDAP